MSETKQEQHRKGRRRVVVGVEDFARGRKGQVRALHRFRQQKQQESLKRSKLLRQYKKAMKQEGYEAGKGVSRKRSRPEEEQLVDDDAIQNLRDRNDGIQQEKLGTRSHEGKRRKTDPFGKARAKAQQQKRQELETKRLQAQAEKDLQAKLKKRKRQAKQMMQRTKKGQPVMKHVINGLLDKLERQSK